MRYYPLFIILGILVAFIAVTGCSCFSRYTNTEPVTDPKKWEHYAITMADYCVEFDFPPATYARKVYVKPGTSTFSPIWDPDVPMQKMSESDMKFYRVNKNRGLLMIDNYDCFKSDPYNGATFFDLTLVRHDDLPDINQFESFLRKEADRFWSLPIIGPNVCVPPEVETVARPKWHAPKTIKVKFQVQKEYAVHGGDYCLAYLFCLSSARSLVFSLSVMAPETRSSVPDRIQLFEQIANTIVITPINQPSGTQKKRP